jgi:hypothetical protein
LTALLLPLLLAAFVFAACTAEGRVAEEPSSITRLIPTSGPLMCQDRIRALGHNLMRNASYQIYWGRTYLLSDCILFFFFFFFFFF